MTKTMLCPTCRRNEKQFADDEECSWCAEDRDEGREPGQRKRN